MCTDEQVKEFERVEALHERAKIIVSTEQCLAASSLELPKFMHFLDVVREVGPPESEHPVLDARALQTCF